MARPRKCRRICAMPKGKEFVPSTSFSDTVVMEVDEFETIRLLDCEKMTQEECAIQMKVSRATVTAIYDSARKKIADCLVNCKRMVIEGGDVSLCENHKSCCGCCGKRNCESCTDKKCGK